MKSPLFVRLNYDLINSNNIHRIDTTYLEELCEIEVVSITGTRYKLSGQATVDFLMRLAPHCLEGKKLKFIKHSWALHNLLGHPILQICSWLKLTKLGFWFHDNTVPKPRQ